MSPFSLRKIAEKWLIDVDEIARVGIGGPQCRVIFTGNFLGSFHERSPFASFRWALLLIYFPHYRRNPPLFLHSPSFSLSLAICHWPSSSVSKDARVINTPQKKRMEPSSSCHRKMEAMKELVRGQDLAKHLQELMSRGGSPSVEDAADQLITSFTNALSMLSRSESDDCSQVSDGHNNNHAATRSEGSSGESSKRKDGRGRYKRR